MRERQALSAEEVQALLGDPGAAGDDVRTGDEGTSERWQADSALLREFVHFLLTGALQATDTGARPPRRIEVGSPVWRDAAELSPTDSWRWARLRGGLSGTIGLSVRAQGVPENAGAPDAQGLALASALLADLPIRIGRLLGLPLQAETAEAIPEVTARQAPFGGSSGGAADGEGSDGWVWFACRSDFGDDGLWELDVGFSAPLAADIVDILEGGASPSALERDPSSVAMFEGSITPRPGGQELASQMSPHSSVRGSVVFQPFRFSPLTGDAPEKPESPDLGLLSNLMLRLTVELGRSQLPLADIMSWRPGSVVVLDRLAGEMVDVLVNGKAIAKGEVLVVEDSFSVKITDIVSPVDRVRSVPWK